MPFLSVNHAEAGGFDPLPIGEYEAIISEVEVTISSNGNPMIKVTLTIREDVEQAGQKRKVKDQLTYTEGAMFKFHQLSKALGFEEGREFESLEQYAEAIAYQPVRFKSKNDNFNGNEIPKVNYYKESQAPIDDTTARKTAIGRGDPFADDGKPIDISDDDLPF